MQLLSLHCLLFLLRANTLGGMFDSIQKRGFGGNRDNSIMRNGLQAGPAKNFSATTETVEVLKGPASVLYGIQDPGGVVNSAEIGRASVGKECRSRWSPYH